MRLVAAVLSGFGPIFWCGTFSLPRTSISLSCPISSILVTIHNCVEVVCAPGHFQSYFYAGFQQLLVCPHDIKSVALVCPQLLEIGKFGWDSVLCSGTFIFVGLLYLSLDRGSSPLI